MKHPLPQEITIALRSLSAWLESPEAPLLRPRLHPDIADCLHSQALASSPRQGYRLTFVVPADEMASAETFRLVLQDYLQAQAQQAHRELQEKMSLGSKALLLALFVVAAMVLLVEWLQAFGQGYLYRLFGESLVIIGWVTMWVPTETLLIEQFPLRRRWKLWQALAQAEVSLKSAG